MRRKKILFSFLIIFFLGMKISPCAQILDVNKDYRIATINLGADDGYLIPGVKLYVLSSQGLVKGIIEIRRVGKYASAAKIIKEYYEIKPQDKVKLCENTLLPRYKSLDYERTSLLTQKSFLSFLSSNPQVKTIEYSRELFKDEAKKSYLHFFPVLEFQKLRGHLLQEGRRVGKYKLLDVVPEWALLSLRVPFVEIARRNYYACLMAKMDLELEKKKAELSLKFLNLLYSYIENQNKLQILKQNLRALIRELKSLKEKKDVYPYLVQRLAVKIREEESLLEIQKNKLNESRIRIALFLNLSPGTDLIIKAPEKLYTQIKNSLKIPEYGYDYLLANYELKIKQAEYIMSKLKIRPTLEYRLAYPSYVSTFKIIIPITGVAAIKVSEIEKKQANYLLEKESLTSKYQVKKLNTKIYYLEKLIEYYQNLQAQVLKIEPDYWQDRLDHEEKIFYLNNTIESLKAEKEKATLKLLKYGNKKTNPEIFISNKLPSLNACLAYAEKRSPEFKYLQLEAQKSFAYLLEAQAQHNKPKANFFKDEYVYKASIKRLKNQELQSSIIKTYLNLVTAAFDYQRSFQLAKIYRQEWEIKKEGKKQRSYLINSAEITYREELIKQIQKKMQESLFYLNLKYLLSNLNEPNMTKNMEIKTGILEEIERTISQLDFDPDIRKRIEKFKVLLATDEVEIAKRGYFITGPWEITYTPKKMPSHGRRGSDWAKIGKAEFVDWIKLYIPTGIIYHTIFGNQIHDVRIADINLEIAKIKYEEAGIAEEHLKNLILQRYNFREANLKASKALLKEVESRYSETKSKIQTFQAQKVDLLASKRLLLNKELDYEHRLQLYLESKVELKDRGYPKFKSPSKVKPLPTILTNIPKLEIVEKEAKIVKEKYKKALKLNFKDFLVIGLHRLGPWFLLKLAPDVNLVRANHIAKEAPLWMEKANVDADLEFQDWVTRIQTMREKIRLLTAVNKKINNYLKEVKNEVALSTAPYSHYIELKMLKDKITQEIQSEKEKTLYALMKLKTLMGIPPEEELIIPDMEMPVTNLPRLAKPNVLADIISRDFPDVKLKESKVQLAYKEKKWDRFLRGLSIGGDFFCDFILSRSYAWNITLEVFDLFLHQLGYYYQDKIQYQNLVLGKERLKIKKKVFLSYYLTQNYFLKANHYKDILDGYKEIINSAWQAYLNKEVPWESEYGILKILNQFVKFENKYTDNLYEYIYNLNYYKELEKKFFTEEKLAPDFAQIPLGILTLDRLTPRKFSAYIRSFLLLLKNKFSLFKNIRRQQQVYLKNIADWDEKESRRNFNLWIYNIQKKKRKKESENISRIYSQAQEKEYRSFLALERIWNRDYHDYQLLRDRIKNLLSVPDKPQYKEQVKKTLLILKPDFPYERSLFTPFNEDDLYNGVTNYFLKYLRNFRFSGKEIKLFFLYLPRVAKIWQNLKKGKNIRLANFWAKYSGGFSYLFILPYFEPNDINTLGLISHYSLVGVYNQQRISPQLAGISNFILRRLKSRLCSESKFLLLNLRTIPKSSVPEFLKWQDYIIKEIDRVSFQHYNFREIEALRKKISRLKVPFWEYLEGNKLEEQIQIDIIRWLIASGEINQERFFSLFQSLPQILYKVYKQPTIKEISHSYSAVRLRYLMKSNNTQLLNREYQKLKRSYMIGLLLFWLNKISIEKIDLPQVKEIISKMEEIRNLPEFIKLYGQHALTDEGYLFYQHSLIYYAQKYKNAYSLKDLKDKFSWMGFLKNNHTFISLYGEINLDSPFLYEKKPIFELFHYIGSLGFWANWASGNKFSRNSVEKFLLLYQKSLNSSKFRNILSNIYKAIGIDIDLSLKQPSFEMEEEIKGLFSNWVLYFYLRKINTPAKILHALDEIQEIAFLAHKNNLHYTQDDLRYWFQHKNEQGYSRKELRQIFNIMSNLRTLLVSAVDDIYHNPQLAPFLDKLRPYLEEIKNKKMHRGEIQRLSEEVIFPQKISLKELRKEYSIGILIQALYLSELHIQLTPYEVTKIFDFIKKEGLEAEDLVKIVHIEKGIYNSLKDKGLPQIFTEPELRKFIWQINYEHGWVFSDNYFKRWTPKLIFFLKEFYQEHNYLPPKRLIYTLLDYNNVYAPDWQLKRLIRKGSFSQEAGNVTLINLGKKLNIKREIFFYAYTKFPLGLDLKNLDMYINFFSSFNIYQTQWILNSEKELEENLAQVLFPEAGNNFSRELKQLILSSFPLLYYVYTNTDVFRERINHFAERAKDGFQELRPNKKIQLLLKSPQKRIALIRKIRTLAKEKYNLNLSPARTYGLIWKLREGYPLEDALEVFLGWHKELTNIYKATRGKDINGEINNLLFHLCQQIYLTPLEITDCKKIFSILKQLDKIYRLKNIVLPDFKLYRDAEVIYFTGLTAKDMKVMYQFLKEAKNYFSPGSWQKLIYVSLKSFHSQLYHIPVLELYSYKDYLKLKDNCNIKLSRLIPLLYRRNITPSGLHYFLEETTSYSSELKLGFKFRKFLLASILYGKTRDPEIVQVSLNLKTNVEAYAFLNKINKLINKQSRKIIKEKIISQCKQ